MYISIAALLFGLSIFLLCISAVLAYFTFFRKSGDKTFVQGKSWSSMIYLAFCTEENIEKAGKMLGFDVQKNAQNCKILRIPNNSMEIIGDKIFALILAAVSVIMGLAVQNMIILGIGMVAALFIFLYRENDVNTKTMKRRHRIEEELPRFLDMLYTALLIGMPVNQAIEITARNLPNFVLSDELLRGIADTQMGIADWQEILRRFASDYAVDGLSDFVLDITNAYQLGSSILDSVERRSTEIKQTNLVMMKEKASKLTNTILLPILLFKLLPILALIGIPIFLQISSGF